MVRKNNSKDDTMEEFFGFVAKTFSWFFTNWKILTNCVTLLLFFWVTLENLFTVIALFFLGSIALGLNYSWLKKKKILRFSFL